MRRLFLCQAFVLAYGVVFGMPTAQVPALPDPIEGGECGVWPYTTETRKGVWVKADSTECDEYSTVAESSIPDSWFGISLAPKTITLGCCVAIPCRHFPNSFCRNFWKGAIDDGGVWFENEPENKYCPDPSDSTLGNELMCWRKPGDNYKHENSMIDTSSVKTAYNALGTNLKGNTDSEETSATDTQKSNTVDNTPGNIISQTAPLGFLPGNIGFPSIGEAFLAPGDTTPNWPILIRRRNG